MDEEQKAYLEYVTSCREAAGTLNAFKDREYDPDATISFDVLAGGFLWSDETPEPFTTEVNYVLKALIRYRTQLQDTDGLKDNWSAIAATCPTWPGFRPDRWAYVKTVGVVEFDYDDF